MPESLPQIQKWGVQGVNTMSFLGRTLIFYISEWETVLLFCKALEGKIFKRAVCWVSKQKYFICFEIFFNKEHEWNLFTQMNNVFIIKSGLL